MCVYSNHILSTYNFLSSKEELEALKKEPQIATKRTEVHFLTHVLLRVRSRIKLIENSSDCVGRMEVGGGRELAPCVFDTCDLERASIKGGRRTVVRSA